MSHYLTKIPLLCVCAFLCIIDFAVAKETKFAEIMPLADQSLLLDITANDTGWVAVGERGHILTSKDGKNWQQANSVPTKTTLTSVFYMQGVHWAAGHESTILVSTDGGNTWVLQFQDNQAEPIMDIVFLDKSHGFALGAYGQLLETNNGGEAWEFLDLNSITLEPAFASADSTEAEDENDYAQAFEDLGCYEVLECHLNALVVLSSQRLLIMGERGYGFRSADNGKHWQAVQLPYQGSMFGALLLNEDCVLTFGLRGHAFKSCDFGVTWEEVETQTQSSLLGGTVNQESIVLVGANGVIVSGSKTKLKLSSKVLDSGINYTAVAMAGKSRGILISTEGATTFGMDAKRTQTAGDSK